MKKFFLSSFVFAASAAYVVYQYVGGSPVSASAVPTTPGTQVVATTQTQPTQTTTSSQNPTPAQTQTPTSVPTPTPAPVTKPKGQYVDGTYTGSTADAYYGLVQVEATVQGGKLTAVKFLQYPNDRSTSRYINSQAMPLLEQEAISAQSAQVSGVSGASDTSQAFRESLASALTKAKNI